MLALLGNTNSIVTNTDLQIDEKFIGGAHILLGTKYLQLDCYSAFVICKLESIGQEVEQYLLVAL